MMFYIFCFFPDPLPGGCNQEFKLENDPNIHLEQHDTSAAVKFQWSNIGKLATL